MDPLPIPSRPDGLIFDLDGTLWDAAESCALVWRYVYADLALDAPVVTADSIRSLSGLRLEKVFRERFPFLPEERHPEIIERYRFHEKDVMRRFGGPSIPACASRCLCCKPAFRCSS